MAEKLTVDLPELRMFGDFELIGAISTSQLPQSLLRLVQVKFISLCFESVKAGKPQTAADKGCGHDGARVTQQGVTHN